MKICIPSVGDKIKLTTDWQFPCFAEWRNSAFLKQFRPDFLPLTLLHRNTDMQTLVVTLPADTILRIDRIYVRKGKKEWDSITFVVCEHPQIKVSKRNGRFWAKLEDVNEIEFEHYRE